MTFTEYIQGGTGTATLSGAVNGTNTSFTLPVTPSELQIYLNGQLQTDRALAQSIWDISWMGTGITFNGSSTPQPGDVLIAWVYIA